MFLHRIFPVLACLCSFVIPGLAQIPEAAHVLMYFPHFADGGPASDQWQTTFTFVNSNRVPVQANLNFYADAGVPLNLDLGTGQTSALNFTVPAYGTRVFKSRIASPNTVVGWAIATASLPLLGNVAFREIRNGAPIAEITANPTLPTSFYLSAANRNLGIAIANRYSSGSVSVSIIAIDSEGRTVGQATASIPGMGHKAFNLYQVVSNLPSDFNGQIAILSASPGDSFVAWTLKADSGALSSLPDGRATTVSQWDRIWLVYARVLASAQREPGFGTQPIRLDIRSESDINANAGNNTVTVYLGLAELISDAPSELAQVLAHELGHIYQQRTGRYYSPLSPNAEFDADFFGVFIAIGAGYDPYGAAGALAKLAMVTGTAGLLQQFEGQLSADAHKSFNERIGFVYQMITTVCSTNAETKAICDSYRQTVHPHFPTFAPLDVIKSY